jgi:hypothetical protein
LPCALPFSAICGASIVVQYNERDDAMVNGWLLCH